MMHIDRVNNYKSLLQLKRGNKSYDPMVFVPIDRNDLFLLSPGVHKHPTLSLLCRREDGYDSHIKRIQNYENYKAIFAFNCGNSTRENILDCRI